MSPESGRLARRQPGHADVLLTAARLTARTRSLWLFGFILGLGALPGMLQHFLLPEILIWLARPAAQRLTAFDNVFDRPGWLLGGVVALFVAGTLFWLLAVMAEGALIFEVDGAARGQPPGLGAAWRAGRRLLPRFIAIDTLLFLPVFIIVLFVMVSATAGFGGFVLAVVNGGAVEIALIAGAAGLLLELGLLVLALLVLVITLVWRTLAFRLAVQAGSNTGDAIRGAGRLLRRRWPAVGGFYLLLWGERRLLLLIVGFLSTPLLLASLPAIGAAMSGGPVPAMSRLYFLLAILAGIARWLLLSAWYAHAGTVWTLAVRQWLAEGAG